MIHAALRWPECAEKDLWHLALAHAIHLHNHTPSMQSGLAPVELWTRSKVSHSALQHAHPWGCPVYVLDPTLQDDKKLPKWQPPSRRGQYLGASPVHASSIGLIRNLRTGNISPQFHVVYDDFFETVHVSDFEEPTEWPELIIFQTYCSDFDEDGYIPELDDEWVDEETLGQQRHQRKVCQHGEEPAVQSERVPLGETLPPEGDPLPRETATVTPRLPASPLAPDTVAGRMEPRRSRRQHNQPACFTFDKQHGYTVVQALVNRTIKSLLTCSSTTHGMQYIHALLLDPQFGLLEGLLPHALAQHLHLLKAAQNDPDTPNFH
jgi:hypothetical protein